jgi:chorismate mutase
VDSKKRIEGWRHKIDAIDDKLLALLNQRASCSIEIGWIKRALNMEIYVPKREVQILERVTRVNRGPLTRESVRRLFERIIDESRSTERVVCSHSSDGAEGRPKRSAGAPARGRQTVARKKRKTNTGRTRKK